MAIGLIQHKPRSSILVCGFRGLCLWILSANLHLAYSSVLAISHEGTSRPWALLRLSLFAFAEQCVFMKYVVRNSWMYAWNITCDSWEAFLFRLV
ncbi:hypothetical protein BDV37DRAFT_211033 [Aspergillus pseudonomiae]|uniref:Uncharacterized protein n=1 Tax=Aspergillus pseudonomiae TaxID=1506151 RepID=A0A5N7D1F1_9EURO|nr:uncharacterized protein BDV37DRAFT_211033 [Aspergillus pseudonomiae]KAE8400204.1 hypothetical protein BDV37DRAFT_211033 [Aspergillus pseudonomiae]